jgi:hypothetical protein
MSVSTLRKLKTMKLLYGENFFTTFASRNRSSEGVLGPSWVRAPHAPHPVRARTYLQNEALVASVAPSGKGPRLHLHFADGALSRSTCAGFLYLFFISFSNCRPPR